eukprot:TRINITY_DN661_c0_g1_i2.p1 TRINITY_DN661_c0_g1~~TRINITY_DN661_c0_g1_i2.p1  ORF type:complete len:131 (+),score=26.83 TRINITY_DN661_c0_g1_i2:166-558(+)
MVLEAIKRAFRLDRDVNLAQKRGASAVEIERERYERKTCEEAMIHGAIKGIAIGSSGGLAGVLILNKTWPVFRRMYVVPKVWVGFVVPVLLGFGFYAEHEQTQCMLRFKEERSKQDGDTTEFSTARIEKW